MKNNKAYGTIAWDNEEETQDISWEIIYCENELFDLILLCDFLVNNKLVKGDMLLKSERELISILKIHLRWKKKKIVNNINKLFDIEIKMIDKGKETDSFFLHF